MTGVPFLGEEGILLLPPHPDQLWCPPSLLPNGYWGLFTRDKAVSTWS